MRTFKDPNHYSPTPSRRDGDEGFFSVRFVNFFQLHSPLLSLRLFRLFWGGVFFLSDWILYSYHLIVVVVIIDIDVHVIHLLGANLEGLC